MSRLVDADLICLLSFPRVSGDEPAAVGGADRVRAFSPRERG